MGLLGTILLLFCILLCQMLNCRAARLRERSGSELRTSGSEERKTLLWVSNPSGLFSQFLQLREMLRLSAQYRRQLIVANFTSSHFVGSLSLCHVFNLSSVASCYMGPLKNATASQCRNSLSAHSQEFKARTSNKTAVCLNKGLLFGSKGKISDPKRLQLMNSPPKLSFLAHFTQTYNTLIRPRIPVDPAGQYTVVHWRRGDQLQTRCRRSWVGLKDYSVNCANASALIKDVRSHPGVSSTPQHPVLVATNEKNESQLGVLRAAPGFHILDDLLRAALRSKPIDSGRIATSMNDELESFVLEALVMLHAPQLLTFGVSTVNDLVESARRDAKRPFCAYLRERDPGVGNWCGLRAKVAAKAAAAATTEKEKVAGEGASAAAMRSRRAQRIVDRVAAQKRERKAVRGEDQEEEDEDGEGEGEESQEQQLEKEKE